VFLFQYNECLCLILQDFLDTKYESCHTNINSIHQHHTQNAKLIDMGFKKNSNKRNLDSTSTVRKAGIRAVLYQNLLALLFSVEEMVNRELPTSFQQNKINDVNVECSRILLNSAKPPRGRTIARSLPIVTESSRVPFTKKYKKIPMPMNLKFRCRCELLAETIYPSS
jgi:hypothetical protein